MPCVIHNVRELTLLPSFRNTRQSNRRPYIDKSVAGAELVCDRRVQGRSRATLVLHVGKDKGRSVSGHAVYWGPGRRVSSAGRRAASSPALLRTSPLALCLCVGSRCRALVLSFLAPGGNRPETMDRRPASGVLLSLGLWNPSQRSSRAAEASL